MAVSSLEAIVPRSHPLVLKVSVIVPCHPNHVPLLEGLFRAYEEQTRPPDEVVVSLSEVDRVPAAWLEKIHQYSAPFSIQLLTYAAVHSPGKNRNLACKRASGDLILCQDADDLPHPQKVELVGYLFEHFEIEHLLHQWISSNEPFTPLFIEGMEKECRGYRVLEQIGLSHIHNGSSSFLKKVFEKVHWNPVRTIDEDRLFNRHASVMFPDHYVLPRALIQYRGEYSTFDLDGTKGTTSQVISDVSFSERYIRSLMHGI